MQKGFAPIYLLVGVVLIGLVLGGAYYLDSNKGLPQNAQQTASTTPSVSPQLTPSPSTSARKVVPLTTAWSLGTKTYSNPKIDITFEYPSFFKVEERDIQKANQEWAEKYKNDPDARQPLYKSSFHAILSTPGEPSEPVNQEICENKMSVSVQKYDNSQNLSLYNFIADLQKTYPGDGITETFETYKKDLKQTNIPQDGSYVFKGIVFENPVKTTYFIHKGKVYTFGLIGNCDTGGQYTPDASRVFESMLKSVKFI